MFDDSTLEFNTQPNTAALQWSVELTVTGGDAVGGFLIIHRCDSVAGEML